jgi:hypothetical protein
LSQQSHRGEVTGASRPRLRVISPIWLAFFAKAVEADPTHIDARAMSVLTLLVLGRSHDAIRLEEQSRPLAPEHPYFTTLLAFGWVLEGNVDRARVYIDGLRPLFERPDHFRQFKELMLIAADLRAATLQPDCNPTSILWKVTQVLGGPALKTTIGFKGKGTFSGTGMPSRIPPFISKAFRFELDELLAENLVLFSAVLKFYPDSFIGLGSYSKMRMSIIRSPAGTRDCLSGWNYSRRVTIFLSNG